MHTGHNTEDDTMRIYSMLAVLLFCITSYTTVFASTACERRHISTVEIADTLQTYNAIKECVELGKDTVVYVSGTGGSVTDALAFFGLMRQDRALCEKVTFIALGQIGSVTNLTFLAGCNRAVLPYTTFLLHGYKLNMQDEDQRVRDSTAHTAFENGRSAVAIAVGDEAASLWDDITRGNQQGMVLSAQDALDMGWATQLIPLDTGRSKDAE